VSAELWEAVVASEAGLQDFCRSEKGSNTCMGAISLVASENLHPLKLSNRIQVQPERCWLSDGRLVGKRLNEGRNLCVVRGNLL
jgi:hypothetical protein